MPGLAYKIGYKIVLLEVLHASLINCLQALRYSVQTETLLDLPKGDDEAVKCEQCGHVEPIYSNISNYLVNN